MDFVTEVKSIYNTKESHQRTEEECSYADTTDAVLQYVSVFRRRPTYLEKFGAFRCRVVAVKIKHAPENRLQITQTEGDFSLVAFLSQSAASPSRAWTSTVECLILWCRQMYQTCSLSLSKFLLQLSITWHHDHSADQICRSAVGLLVLISILYLTFITTVFSRATGHWVEILHCLSVDFCFTWRQPIRISSPFVKFRMAIRNGSSYSLHVWF